MVRTCDFCGAAFDDAGQSVTIDGLDGLFDSIRCGLKARESRRREEQRVRLERAARAYARAEASEDIAADGHFLLAPPAP